MPNCYTWFNPIQPPRAHFLCLRPGTDRIEACSQSHTTFSMLTIFSPAHLSSTTFFPFFIGYDHSHLQRLLFLVYISLGNMEILLPAYFNNIVNRYKATIHLIVGRRLSFIVQGGFFIPPTYKVLLAIYYNGFMPVAYCFLISTAKVLPSVCLRRQLAHNIEPRNQQHLTLAISTTPFPRYSQLLTNLLSSCKRVLLERNLFFFELQIVFFKELMSTQPIQTVFRRAFDPQPIFTTP